MKNNTRVLLTGALIIAGLMVGRLVLTNAMADQDGLFSRPRVASFLLKAETGKEPVTQQMQNKPEPTEATQPTTPAATQPPTEEITDPTQEDVTTEATEEGTEEPTESMVMPKPSQEPYAFEAGDENLTKIGNMTSKQPDVKALLTQKLEWDLTGPEPTVLIVHTHGTEAFTQTEGSTYNEEGGAYRTTNGDYNVTSLGAELARLLEEAGIHVVHDRDYYDHPDYEAAYDNSRAGIQSALKKYPSIQLVIDLHRDSSEGEDGQQWISNAIINGEQSAQVMMVMGTDAYYTNPDWEYNLSIALKLNTIIEKAHPGTTRNLSLRRQRFNQDLFPGSILVEVGSAGNTHQQATNAATLLAEAIILMAKGTK